MAGQNYGSAHLNAVDERVYLESQTMDAFDSKRIRLDFNGKNSVTIYIRCTVSTSATSTTKTLFSDFF